MCAAPFIVLGATVILCLSPLAIPFIPALLWYWYREKRAGRTLRLRTWFGNNSDPEPEEGALALTEPNEPQAVDLPASLPDADEVPLAR